MPVVIAEAVEILDAPFSGAATIVNICVIVLALVVYITAVIVGSPFSILDIDIASVLITTGDYICVSDSVCDWRDVAGPVDSNKVVRYCRALLENPETFGCGKVVFTVIPQKVLILAFFRYAHIPVDSLRDKLSVQLGAVYGAASHNRI